MADTINLAQLPKPEIVEQISYDDTLAARKAHYIALCDESEQQNAENTLALESEPATKQLEENSYREIVWRERINNAALATMPAFATGTDLDVRVAERDITRKVLGTAPDGSQIMESDSDLLYRYQHAPEKLSVAGPGGAYRAFALDADDNVVDAGVVSPQPCYITVAILGNTETGTPTQATLDAVTAALNAEETRPIADRVTVQAVELVDYQITAAIYTYPDASAEIAMQQAQANLQAYLTESHRIGRDIARSAIFACLHIEGVQHVELTSPADDVAISDLQCAHCTAQTITYGGTDV